MALVTLPLGNRGLTPESGLEVAPTGKFVEWDKFRHFGQQMYKRADGTVDFSYLATFTADPLTLYYRPTLQRPLQALSYEVVNADGQTERTEPLRLGFAMMLDTVRVGIEGAAPNLFPITVLGTHEDELVRVQFASFAVLKEQVELGFVPLSAEVV